MMHFLLIAASVLFMVFFFGFCIFIHELGHFLAAKWRGLHVSAFSIGFKKAWGRKYHGVEYRIGWLPFGGYVEIPQVDEKDSKKPIKDENGIELKPAKPLDMMITVFAGPFFNFLFGFALAVVIWIAGFPIGLPELREIEVASVEQNSPEFRAGLRPGDRIVALNGKQINTNWQGLVRDILITIGPVKLSVLRNGKTQEIAYIPAVNKKYMPDEEIAYPFFTPKIPLMLYPEKNSPAAKAGVLDGDRLIAVNGKDVSSFEEISLAVDDSLGKPLSFRVERKGKTVELSGIVPKPDEAEGESGRWMIGIMYNPDTMVVNGSVKGGPAEKAGLAKDDRIVSIGGEPATAELVAERIAMGKGAPVELVCLRAGKEIRCSLRPEFKKFYTIGIQYAYLTHPNPWKQFSDVMVLTYKSMRGIAVAVGNRLGLTNAATTIKPKHASGPLGIGRVLYLSIYRGSFIQGLYLVVIITFNLGLLNLLPIPVLDGGTFVLSLLEMILRRPVSPALLRPITYAFVGFLICFMIYVTFYDAKRLVNDFIPKEPGAKTAPAAAAPAQNNVPAKTNP